VSAGTQVLTSRALLCWLDELDEALIGAAPTADTERRLDALIDEGVALFAGATPADPSAVDAVVVDRVQQRLRTIADGVATELDAVRRTRRELTRTRRAHAGYRATTP
jgi:hypothetical protein